MDFRLSLVLLSGLLPGLVQADVWQDIEPGCQAIYDNFANSVIEGNHFLWSHEFILWVCNELS